MTFHVAQSFFLTVFLEFYSSLAARIFRDSFSAAEFNKRNFPVKWDLLIASSYKNGFTVNQFLHAFELKLEKNISSEWRTKAVKEILWLVLVLFLAHFQDSSYPCIGDASFAHRLMRSINTVNYFWFNASLHIDIILLVTILSFTISHNKFSGRSVYCFIAQSGLYIAFS